MNNISYFGIGASMAGIVNLETFISDPPQVVTDGAIPAVGVTQTLLSNGSLRYDGAINTTYRFDNVERSEFNAFILAQFGSFSVSSSAKYVTWIDEEGFWSPYLVEMSRPAPLSGWRNVNETYLVDVVGELRRCRKQYVTKTANYTITTSDKLVYADTTSGNITLTLPPLASVTAGTVYSCQKAATANTLTIAADGSEAIGGSATLSLTANYARVDLCKNTASDWKIINAR